MVVVEHLQIVLGESVGSAGRGFKPHFAWPSWPVQLMTPTILSTLSRGERLAIAGTYSLTLLEVLLGRHAGQSLSFVG